MKLSRKATPLFVVAALTPVWAGAAEKNQYQLDFRARLVHFDREFENPANDRTQTGLGLQLNYETPYYWDIIGFGLSGYGVVKLDASGRVTSDVLKADDSGGFEDAFGKIAQAFVKMKYQNLAQLKLGRQLHRSLLLSSSTSRAVPNTFSGGTAELTPVKGLSVYGAVYDRWSPRAGTRFEEFQTDRSAEGDIKYISLIGAEYKTGPFEVNLEYLNSKDYLSKVGLVGAYTIALANKNKLKLEAGVHTSRDAGRLFVTGSESGELDDEDVTGSRLGVTRSDNNGLGMYVEAEWTSGNVRLGAAVAKFNGAWIEDNFAGDHGTNVFPTGGVLADMTNRDETLWMVRAGYDWRDYVKGLRTTVSLKRGTGAKNSHVAALGSASEQEFEIDIRYQIPIVKGLNFRWRYLDYRSDKTGRLDGVKEDETDHRIYLDYTYRFF